MNSDKLFTTDHYAAAQEPQQPPDDKTRKVWVATELAPDSIREVLLSRARIGWNGHPPTDTGGVWAFAFDRYSLENRRPLRDPGRDRWAPKEEMHGQVHLVGTGHIQESWVNVSTASGPFGSEIRRRVLGSRATFLGAAYPRDNDYRVIADTQLCVSGSPYADESVEDAALREVREELGIAVELISWERPRTNRKGVTHYLFWAVAR